MRIALVHDYLLVMRGAERTFAAIADVWPDAPIYTLLYDEEGTQGHFAGRTIITSPLQRLGARQRTFRALLPLFEPAVRAFSFEDYDCVFTSSSAFAHGVRIPVGARHVCYCHSPFRYAWLNEEPMAVPGVLRPWIELQMGRHRAFDRRAARGVDRFVANSKLTAERIRRFWGHDSTVIHPPVDVERFSIGSPSDYVLYVGELLKHKRVDVAIAAAASAGRKIKVVGEGPEETKLKARFQGSAEFLGRVSDEELTELYAGALALVVPKVEEFGIAAVEAQAAGRPVIGIDAGGTRETVRKGKTGLLVPPGDDGALAQALRTDLTHFDSEAIREHAWRFSRARFAARIKDVVMDLEEAEPVRHPITGGRTGHRIAGTRR